MSIIMQKEEEIKQIVEQCLDERMAQFVLPPQLERATNLGAELRHQRELMRQGFENADKCFEAMDRRFEAVDKRFEELRSDMNQRFEAVDRRFEELRSDMNQRFEAVDKRFEELRSDMNQRFEMLISSMDKRFAFMQWLIVAGFGTLSLMLTFYKFFTV